MALILKNLTGSNVEINDLGLSVPAGGTYDLSYQDKPSQVVRSAQTDGDLYANIITSANLAVLDPLDDVTQLNAATSIEILQRHNDSHYRIQGGELDQLDDVTLTSPADTEVLTYSGGQWINVPSSVVGAGASLQLEWRFSTSTIEADPGSQRFRYDNSDPALVTEIYVNDIAKSNVDASTILNQLTAGDKLYIQQKDTALAASLFTIVSVTDNTGWFTIAVTVDDSELLPSNNKDCGWILFWTGADALQNLWETVAGDTGSTTASSPTQTLTIAGGTNISTAMSGNTLTINADLSGLTLEQLGDIFYTGSPAPTDGQVLVYRTGSPEGWTNEDPVDEKVKVSANDTTSDYLENKVVGTTDQISVTTLNDGGDEDVKIAIADNVILPGSEGMLAPSGTTAERPAGSPINDGTLRFNETLGVYEYYLNGEWITVANSASAGGSILGFHFLWGGNVEDAWFGTTTNHFTSDESPYVIPWDCKLVGLGFNNVIQNVNDDIELYKGTPTGSPAAWTSERILTIQARDIRTFYVSNLNISLAAGTVLGAYVRKIASGNIKPSLPIFSVFVQVDGDFTPQEYTAYGTVAVDDPGGALVAAASAETNPAKIIGP